MAKSGKLTAESERKSAAARERHLRSRQKVYDDRWRMARAYFEWDPRVTYSSLARELEVTRQRVAEKAKQEGWKRLGDDPAALARAAHVAAGGELPEPLQEESPPPIPPAPPPASDAPPGNVMPKAVLPGPGGKADYSVEAQEQAVATRAEVISRHRGEWRAVRGLLGEAVRARDFNKGKLAKVVADALTLTQNGERKAWGLDMAEPPPAGGATVRVVVEREGPTPAPIRVERGD